MNNFTNESSMLTLQGFNIPSETIIPSVFFAILGYMIILFCNSVLLLTIILNKSLHQPMYMLLLNLPVNDLMGSTALFPQVIKELLWDTRTIPFSTCVTQAFFIHVYATAVLFILLLRLPRCRSLLTNTYCDNPSLLQLTCGNMAINNIYGLLTVAVCQVATVGLIAFTYLQILIACFRNKSSDTHSKALQTCATHLTVFIIFECLGLFTVISYRLTDSPQHLRQFSGVAAMILPPTLNPIIYGLRTKEIRTKVLKSVKRMVYPS
ncbi:olfactory receptor 52D1-like [Brachyhypopomus gauderio]|uniref:olfactory receptor 52D1-like n=1 Tax=Brachyhypopomus gauderio TaxID=698409 RepID=UPI00404293E0